MKPLIVIFLFSVTCLVTACDTIYGESGLIHDRNQDYLKSQNRPPLRVPPSLSKVKISNEYNIQAVAGLKAPNLAPPGSLLYQVKRDQVALKHSPAATSTHS